MATYVECAKCAESVSEQATRCPHCGYDPAKYHRRRKKWLGGIGGLLIMTVVGSPIGLFLYWRSRKHGKKAKRATLATAI